MENLVKLTDYKSAPTANIQSAGRRNKKMYKYSWSWQSLSNKKINKQR